VAALALSASSLVAQTTVYFDDFSGDSATDLNGTVPDTASGYGGGTASAPWLAGGNLNADGIVANDLPPSGGVLGLGAALLPFSPQFGYRYVLSADIIGSTANTNRYIGVGFTHGADAAWLADPGNSSAYWLSPATFNPVLWALSRFGSATPSVDQAFAGPGTAGAVNSTTTSARTLKITLDTRGTNWTVTWALLTNGTTTGWVTYTNSTILPDFDIQYVGFTSQGNNVGQRIGNFTLTAEQLVTETVAPSIVLQPVGFTNYVNISASLKAVAIGSTPLSFQWYQNDTALAGATSKTLSFASLDLTNSGSYYLVITNSAGSVTSTVASVVVYATNFFSPTLSVWRIPNTGSDAASGISSSKNYLCALDFGNTATAFSINGVIFQQLSSGYTGPGLGRYWGAPLFVGTDATYGGSFVISGEKISASTSATMGLGATGNANYSSQADGNLGELLRDIAYINANATFTNTVITLKFGQLTPGKAYSLRHYFRQWTPPTTGRPVLFTFNGHGTNEICQMDTDIGGAFCLQYDFTAATNTVTMSLAPQVYNFGALIYGVTLESSEPAVNLAPVMLLQPKGFTNWVSSLSFVNYTMSAYAAGTQPITYTWYKNGVNMGLASTNSLSLGSAYAGSYQMVADNAYGSVTSSVAVYAVAGVSDTVVLSPSLSVVGLPATGTDAASGISSANTYLCALDTSAVATAPLTINGVSFQQVVLTNGGPSVRNPVCSGVDPTYGGTWKFSYTNSNPGGTLGFQSAASGGTAGQADGSMLSLLTDMCYPQSPAIGDPMIVELVGLTPTAQYSLRYYYRQWGAVGNGRVITFTFNGQGMSETCVVDIDAGGAKYVKYDFTAASTTATMKTEEFVASGPTVYGITLQQTAPPVLLQHSKSQNNLTLFWDIALTGFTLESTDKLPATTWTAVGGVVDNSVTVDASTGAKFYRLHKP
jgi:hypothetical protein